MVLKYVVCFIEVKQSTGSQRSWSREGGGVGWERRVGGLEVGCIHRIIRYRMRALSRDRGPI